MQFIAVLLELIKLYAFAHFNEIIEPSEIAWRVCVANHTVRAFSGLTQSSRNVSDHLTESGLNSSGLVKIP